MAPRSTYAFGKTTTVDDLLRTAYLRIGVKPDLLTPLEAKDALLSLNLEMSTWMGRRLDLWLVQRQMSQLYPGQSIYTLPDRTVRVLEVSGIRPQRLNIGGTPFASEGNADNVFLPGNTAGCIQTTPDGYIGYDYGTTLPAQSIMYVGVLARVPNQTYALDVQYSFNEPGWTVGGAKWVTVMQVPAQEYPTTQIQWLVVQNSLNARAWRIKETQGATLNIEQLYFSQPTQSGNADLTLSPSSREGYMSLGNKIMRTDNPGQFYLDQQADKCSLIIWPVPQVGENQVSALLYTGYNYPSDVTSLTQILSIPPVFYDAVSASLAVRLASMNPMFDLAKMQYLEGKATEAFRMAGETNYERVPLQFSYDMSAYS